MARKHGGFGGKVTAVAGAARGPRHARPTRSATCRRRRTSRCCIASTATRTRCTPIRERAKVAGLRAPDPARRGELRRRRARDPAHAADYQPEQLASIEARFSRPVFPGETIRTEMWPDGARVPFHCRVVERGEIVLEQRTRDVAD